MNCREFIIEFEERGTLSEPATLHLTICTDCRKMSERQTQVWLLIDDLKPVAAPSDFDFRVKARIASAKPSDFQSPRFLPILRYVLPLSVVVLLFGLLVFGSGYFFASSTTSPVAQNAGGIPSSQNTLPVNLAPANQLAFTAANDNKTNVESFSSKEILSAKLPSKPAERTKNTQDIKYVAATFPSNKQTKPLKKSVSANSDGGSHTTALSVGSMLTPRGINLNADANNTSKIDTPKPADDENILKFFGIQTTAVNGRRTVKAVDKNSAAERSGVKAGDVVENIKDNFLTISRGTEKIEIVLLNETTQKP